jgi:hypothetical protein
LTFHEPFSREIRKVSVGTTKWTAVVPTEAPGASSSSLSTPITTWQVVLQTPDEWVRRIIDWDPFLAFFPQTTNPTSQTPHKKNKKTKNKDKIPIPKMHASGGAANTRQAGATHHRLGPFPGLLKTLSEVVAQLS